MSKLTTINIRKLKRARTANDQQVKEMIDQKILSEKDELEVYSPKTRVVKTAQEVSVKQKKKSSDSSSSFFSKPKVESKEEQTQESQSLYRKEFIDDKIVPDFYSVKSEKKEPVKVEEEKKKTFFGFKSKK
jgi:hypothetical protein